MSTTRNAIAAETWHGLGAPPPVRAPMSKRQVRCLQNSPALQARAIARYPKTHPDREARKREWARYYRQPWPAELGCDCDGVGELGAEIVVAGYRIQIPGTPPTAQQRQQAEQIITELQQQRRDYDRMYDAVHAKIAHARAWGKAPPGIVLRVQKELPALGNSISRAEQMVEAAFKRAVAAGALTDQGQPRQLGAFPLLLVLGLVAIAIIAAYFTTSAIVAFIAAAPARRLQMAQVLNYERQSDAEWARWLAINDPATQGGSTKPRPGTRPTSSNKPPRIPGPFTPPEPPTLRPPPANPATGAERVATNLGTIGIIAAAGVAVFMLSSKGKGGRRR